MRSGYRMSVHHRHCAPTCPTFVLLSPFSKDFVLCSTMCNAKVRIFYGDGLQGFRGPRAFRRLPTKGVRCEIACISKKALHVQAEFQQGLILSSKMRKAKVRISHGDGLQGFMGPRAFRRLQTKGVRCEIACISKTNSFACAGGVSARLDFVQQDAQGKGAHFSRGFKRL